MSKSIQDDLVTDNSVPPNTQENNTEDNAKAIFDKRYKIFSDGLQPVITEIQPDLAFSIMIKDGMPYIYSKGHDFDIAKMLAHIVEQMRSQLYHELHPGESG
jgi:hypothetical protein